MEKALPPVTGAFGKCLIVVYHFPEFVIEGYSINKLVAVYFPEVGGL